MGWNFRGFALQSEMVAPCKCRAALMAAEHKSKRTAGAVWNFAFWNCWRAHFARRGREYAKPLPPSALLTALVAGSLTTITVFTALRYFSRASVFDTKPEPIATHKSMGTATGITTGVIAFFIVWPLIQMTSALGGVIQFQFTDMRAPIVGHQFLETIREQGNNPVTWGLVFTIVILGPLAEEIIWRGAIQQGLKQIECCAPARF